MKEEKDKRRSFLKHILSGSAVVVTAAAAIKPTRAKASARGRQPEEILYTESVDFRQYYKSIRS